MYVNDIVYKYLDIHNIHYATYQILVNIGLIGEFIQVYRSAQFISRDNNAINTASMTSDINSWLYRNRFKNTKTIR